MRVTATLPGGATPAGGNRASSMPALMPAPDDADTGLLPATADRGRTARPMLTHRRSAPFLAQLVQQYAPADDCNAERADRRRAADTAYSRRARTGLSGSRPGSRANLKA